MIRYLMPLSAFVILVGFFYVGLGKDPSFVPSPLIGKAAPRFDLPDLLNPDNTIGSKDFDGQVVVLNVWATWCVGCREEHDALLAIAQQNIVPIYGLNWKDESDMARVWLDKLGDPYTATAVDLDGRVAIDWGVYGAPETFLIGADGIVLHKHLSPLTMDIWRHEFLPLIFQAQEAAK